MALFFCCGASRSVTRGWGGVGVSGPLRGKRTAPGGGLRAAVAGRQGSRGGGEAVRKPPQRSGAGRSSGRRGSRRPACEAGDRAEKPDSKINF